LIASNDPSPAGPDRQTDMSISYLIIKSHMDTTKTSIFPQLNGPIDLFIHGLTDEPLDESISFLGWDPSNQSNNFPLGLLNGMGHFIPNERGGVRLF
jgi:hypothetical protein